ncbi:MAG: MFS transporter [Phycisphaeraceae bacterium]|nr:MFS transporter [Phycisphaeraceae bacterium]MCB9848362.1 MFS transporter [Phycisphaeraceae bacterium]
MIERLKPFRALPNPREVFAWGMYDLANQSFTLLILTLLLPIYVKSVAVSDPASGDRVWSTVYAASMLLVVCSSPFVGAFADARGAKKRLLIGTGIACVLLTASFALIGPGGWVLAAALFIPANYCYQIGENMLASFLPEVASQRNLGRVSAIGWTMGYVGALLLLVLVVGGMLALSMGPPERWRPFFVFAAVWFGLGMIAPARVLIERRPAGTPPSIALCTRLALDRLRTTVRDAAGHRQLLRFLLAFFVYALGVQTIIAFAGIIAHDFGFDQTRLALFVLQLTVTAGIGAVLTGMHQDRLGPRRTLVIFLCVWIATCLTMVGLALPKDPPQWLFWIAGNGVGLGLGGVGTASRAMVGTFTPSHKTAEFFGLWGMTYKGAGVVGVLSFGQVKASLGSTASLLLLTGFFVVGLALLLRVNVNAGRRSALRAQRAHASYTPGA